MTLRVVKGTAKKARAIHWWAYDGVFRVACGKQYSQGDQPLQSTVDIKNVTCKQCKRIHARREGVQPAMVKQLMAVVR